MPSPRASEAARRVRGSTGSPAFRPQKRPWSREFEACSSSRCFLRRERRALCADRLRAGFSAAQLWLVLWLALAGAGATGQGAVAKVSLRDGAVREGEVRLLPTGALELRTAGAVATTIPFAQLDRMVFGAAAPRPAPSVELRAGQGIAPWQLANVGSSVTSAMLGETQGVWTLGTAPGDSRHGYEDFHFLHHPLVGDGELVVHLLRYSDKVDYSRSGIGFLSPWPTAHAMCG